jgi:thiamine biosynthesis lipoprotein
MRAERAFHAMGSDAHVVVTGDQRLLDVAQARLAQLEARWSRFRLDSEISRLNRANGAPRIVSADTALLVQRSVEAWRATAGAFDPSVHDAVVDLGYDRDFRVLPGSRATAPPVTRPAPGLGDVLVDPAADVVRLPPGVHLDPGGIGKGLAADLVVLDLLAEGAPGACVSVGGDLRVAGAPPERDCWSVSIADPRHAGRELVRIDLTSGGVATSSRLRRRWWRSGVEYHHVVDPRTGRPATSAAVAATAVADEASLAEVRATEALLVPDAIADAHDVELLVVDEDGGLRATRTFEEVLACSRP